jgi:hypothetical protein
MSPAFSLWLYRYRQLIEALLQQTQAFPSGGWTAAA